MYNQEIETVLDISNKQIYEDLCQFLLDSHNKLMSAAAKVDETSQSTSFSSFTSLGDSILKEQASQVPTCLILSSSESASSVDTQFEQLLKQIKKKLDAFTIFLDERKCGNLKQTIQHIQFKLRISLGISFDDAKKVYDVPVDQQDLVQDNRQRKEKDTIMVPMYEPEVEVEEVEDSNSEEENKGQYI